MSRHCKHSSRSLTLGVAVFCSFAAAQLVAADPSPKLTVRDVNIYVMSAYGSALNQRDAFRSTLPGFASPKRTTADRKHLNEPSPAGLLTFEGSPNPDVDVLLEFDNGRFFSSWPPATQRSKRLLWQHLKLSPSAEAPPILPEGHWLAHLRTADRLWIETGRRTDRYMLYDAELPMAPPVKVSTASEGYGLTNLGKYPLLDVVVYRPQPDGWLTASLDLLESTASKEDKPANGSAAPATPDAVFEDTSPSTASATPSTTPPAAPATVISDAPSAALPAAAAPVQVKAIRAATNTTVVVIDAPAAAVPATPESAEVSPAANPESNPPVEEKVVVVPISKNSQSKEQIVQSWRERLSKLGLGDPEIDHLTSILQGQALRSDSATIVFRLGDEQLDTMLPLEITPFADKQIRVALVVLLDADPDLMNRVEQLIAQLGDPSYEQREAAEKRLRELGPAATPKLQEALANSDPEISFRAQELIESFDFPQGGPAAIAN